MRTYVDYGRFVALGDPAAGGLQIPKEPKNADYAEALAMVDAGTAEIVAYQPPEPTDADRVGARQAIDAAAESCRLQWITPGAGQAMVYQAKRAEAERWVASGGEGDYPILAASVGVEAGDLAGVAALVLGTTAAWTEIAAAIEHLRLSAKKAAGEAATWAEIDAAKTVDWPAP